MGVNMAGNCIVDDEVCCEASRQEIIRRYYKSCDALLTGDRYRGRGTQDRTSAETGTCISGQTAKSFLPALPKEQETGAPAAALELPDGRIIYW